MDNEKKSRFGYNELLLLCFSILFVLAILFIIDKILSFHLVRSFLLNYHGKIALIFPPHSQEEFITTDFHYTVQTNSIGIRDKEISIPKRNDTFRILVFGDSYTYGWGVNIEQTWVRLLEKKLNVKRHKVETVNLGKPGADPWFYLELAQTAISILEPDLILIGLLQGDDLLATCANNFQTRKPNPIPFVTYLYPNITQQIEKYILQYKLIQQSKQYSPLLNNADKNKQASVNSAKEILSQLNSDERTRFEQLDSDIRNAFLDGLINPFLISVAVKYPDLIMSPLKESSDPSIKPCIDNLVKILQEIHLIAKKSGSPIIVISVPQGFYVNQHSLKTAERLHFKLSPEVLTSKNIDNHFQIACQELQLPLITLTDEFRAQKDNSTLFFPIDGHLTAEGHKFFADILSNKLQKWLDKNINTNE
ncbi:MAG: SGNH/GDSL hydrolase family protein [Candidatus Hydrogenedens sp.]|nr:SGNH/GDSL hydrolase family protein [Candidatus Hydrogenedens sp.]